MTRRRALVAALIAGVALWSAVALAPGPRRADPFAGFRQVSEQEIPGSFGYTLLAPGDDTPSVDPSVVYPTLVGARGDRNVTLTYARVTNPAEGAAWGPAWVFLTRNLCYFTAKGDFVSPSRAGQDDGCTVNNMLVQVVDAQSGTFVAAFDAYDPLGTWSPDRGGTTAQATGLTRFH